jgi:hypothetical protein
VIERLEADFPGLPTHRVDRLLEEAAAGRLAKDRLDAESWAVLLAVLGRSWTVGGTVLEAGLDLRPWDAAATEEAAKDLLDVASVRRDLEAGRPSPPAALTRLERAAIATLGRLSLLP